MYQLSEGNFMKLIFWNWKLKLKLKSVSIKWEQFCEIYILRLTKLKDMFFNYDINTSNNVNKIFLCSNFLIPIMYWYKPISNHIGDLISLIIAMLFLNEKKIRFCNQSVLTEKHWGIKNLIMIFQMHYWLCLLVTIQTKTLFI